jgi:hypothetical protein
MGGTELYNKLRLGSLRDGTEGQVASTCSIAKRLSATDLVSAKVVEDILVCSPGPAECREDRGDK